MNEPVLMYIGQFLFFLPIPTLAAATSTAMSRRIPISNAKSGEKMKPP